jgi:hypothetical protein
MVSSVLERLRGAALIEDHLTLVDDHMHTDFVVLALSDGSQAYVRFRRRRGRCETEQIAVLFEDGEVHILTGDDKCHFENRFWDVIE